MACSAALRAFLILWVVEGFNKGRAGSSGSPPGYAAPNRAIIRADIIHLKSHNKAFCKHFTVINCVKYVFYDIAADR